MTPRPTPLQKLLGPEPKSEGARYWLNRDDFQAAALAVHQIEAGQAAARLRRAASLDAWAGAFGVTVSAVENWVTERKAPGLGHLVQLGRALRSLGLAEIERDRTRRGSVRWEDVDDGSTDD